MSDTTNTFLPPYLVIITGTNGPSGSHQGICNSYDAIAKFLNTSNFAKEHDSGTEAWKFMGYDSSPFNVEEVSGIVNHIWFHDKDRSGDPQCDFDGDEGYWSVQIHSISDMMQDKVDEDAFFDLNNLL